MSWKTYTVKEPTELTVSKYVKERFSLSSRDIQMMFRKKRVKVNSRVAHSQRSLKKGDVLTLELPQDKDYGVDVEKGPLQFSTKMLIPWWLIKLHSCLFIQRGKLKLVH